MRSTIKMWCFVFPYSFATLSWPKTAKWPIMVYQSIWH